MEKYIFIIKCVSTINNITKVDNCYAVTSEEEAKQDIVKMTKKMKEESIFDFCYNYYYEKIRLFD